MTARRSGGGFTLIELMVALAILAVIVAVALPSYRSYVLRSHRTDGIATLTTNQAILERCYAQSFKYDPCAPTTLGPSPQGFYTIDFVPGTLTATTYTLRAVAGASQQADTGCTTLTLDQANQRTPLACWNP